MKGRLLSYKDEIDEGIALGEDKKKYKVNVMDWDDMDNLPQKGLYIEFTPEGLVARNIVVSSNQQPATQNSEVATSATEEKNVQVENSIKPTLKATANLSKDKKLDNIDFDTLTEIPISPDYEMFLSNYFRDSLTTLENNSIKGDKVLSYPLMKRFLSTAYDHLLDKDPTFIDQKLGDLKIVLERTYRVYRALEELTSYPEAKFESVFLKNQSVYYKIYLKFEQHKIRVSKLSEVVTDLEKSIKSSEKTLFGMTPKSPRYNQLDQKLKKMRTNFVDKLEEMTKLKNQNNIYYTLMNNFKELHRKPFVDYFKKQSEIITSQLLLLLNSNAYLFDSYMWELAKKSQGIKRFFIEANIDGSFSSKTFLKYFLNSLDENKMSDEYKSMQELLHYLESLEKGSILIVDDRSEMLPSLRYFANHVDKDFRVKLLRPIDVLNELSKNQVNYIIVNIHIRGIHLFELIKKVQQVRKSLSFILTSDKFTKELLVRAKTVGVKHFVATNVEDKVLLETLEKIVHPK
jgi:CheY-like chemotaxis protein